jgi:hypothetical protein
LSVITEIAVVQVEFRCPESHWEDTVEYDVVLYVDAEGDTLEFFSLDGVPVMSPYTVDGAPFCPVCHRPVPGRPIARRFIPAPPGEGGRPARRVPRTDRDRSQDLPLLSGRRTL